jgi:hypothetical protein
MVKTEIRERNGRVKSHTIVRQVPAARRSVVGEKEEDQNAEKKSHVDFVFPPMHEELLPRSQSGR